MSRTQRAAEKYRGEKAREYNAKRAHKPMWHREAEVLRAMLEDRKPGEYLLDCPVGTGRFLPMWAELGFCVTGVDINKDMLKEAAKMRTRADTTMLEGSIFKLPFSAEAFDVAVAIRIITLIEEADMVRALKELQRVTRYEIIFNTRVVVPGERPRKNVQSLDVVERFLAPGWRLAENVEIHEPSFRMIRLRSALCAG